MGLMLSPAEQVEALVRASSAEILGREGDGAVPVRIVVDMVCGQIRRGNVVYDPVTDTVEVTERGRRLVLARRVREQHGEAEAGGLGDE